MREVKKTLLETIQKEKMKTINQNIQGDIWIWAQNEKEKHGKIKEGKVKEWEGVKDRLALMIGQWHSQLYPIH